MHDRRAQGLPGLAVNWGPWRDVGMAATLDAAGQRAVARRGLMPLETAAAVRALPALVRSGAAQFVAARIDWRKVLQEMGSAATPWVETLARLGAEPSPGHGGFRARLEQAPQQDRHQLLLEHVRDSIAGLLGLPAGTPVELDCGFRELGLDSLGVLTLRNGLQTTLGITLPATVAFKFSNVQSLVEYLAETLGLTPLPVADPRVVEEEDPGVKAAAELDQLSLPEVADRLAARLAAIRSGYGKT